MNKEQFCLVLMLFCSFACFSLELPDGNKITTRNIETYESGDIKRVEFDGSVNIETSIGNITFINELEYYQSGKLLSGDIDGVIKISTKYGSIEADTLLRFYESGSLKTCYIQKHDQKLMTSLGELMASERIHFYENGTINSVQSYYFDANLNNNKIKLWLIQFDENDNFIYGRIEKGSIKDPFDNLLEAEEIYLFDNGLEIYLSSIKPVIIQIENKYIKMKSAFISEKYVAYLPENKFAIGNEIFGDSTYILLDFSGKTLGKCKIDQTAHYIIEEKYF